MTISSVRRNALSRLVSRFITVLLRPRHCGLTHQTKHFQRRLALLHRLGVMPLPRHA